jgi:HemY protein
MRWLAIIIFLLLGSAIGVLFNNGSGEAVFFYDGWQIEMPMWIVALSLVVFSCLLALIVRFISKVEYVGLITKGFLEKKRVKNAHAATQKSLELIILGDLEQANKVAEKASLLSDSLAVVNQMTLARSAHEAGNYQRRDEIINSLMKKDGKNSKVYKVLLAKLKLQSDEVVEAHSILLEVYEKTKNKEALRLLSMSSIEIRDFQCCENLLAPLKRNNIFSQGEFEDLQVSMFQDYIEDTAKNHGLQELKALWKRVPKKIRKNPSVKASYITALQMIDVDTMSAKLLQEHLSSSYDAELVRPLLQEKNIEVDKKRKLLEKWVSGRSGDLILLEGLGVIYMQRGIHGKAMSLFEQVISISPGARIYTLMGDLFEAMGKSEEAKNYYKKGAMFSTSAPVLLETSESKSITTTEPHVS